MNLVEADRTKDPPGARLQEPETEEALIRKAIRDVRGGDREAFGRVVQAFQSRIFGLTLMMLRNPSSAEDITQDAFVRAFTQLDAFDDRRPFYPWLATIAVRLAQNRLKKLARLTTREGSGPDPELQPSTERSPVDRLIADEQSRWIWDEVAALPTGQRTAALLYYAHEMKVAEIAAALGVTGGTVKTLLFRARRRLRTSVTARDETPEKNS